MFTTFGVLKAALADLWADLFTTAVCNLLWLLAQILILPGPPATVALFYMGNRIAHGEAVDVQDFLEAVRKFWGLGWRWGAVNLVVLAVLFGDLFLVGRLSQSNPGRFAQGLYLVLPGVWGLLQLFALPFLFEQHEPSVRQAWRNGAVLIGRNLPFALGVGLTAGAILLVGAFLFLLSLAAGGMFLALVGNRAVLDRLEAHRSAQIARK